MGSFNNGREENALVPAGFFPFSQEESQNSTGSSEAVVDGDFVKLFVAGFGEVGDGCVVEACPLGQWLGVVIPLEPWMYVLVRPLTISLAARTLLVDPCQRELKTLGDALDRTILWQLSAVAKTPRDPPMGSSPYVPQSESVGLEVHLQDDGGQLISSGRVNCCQPNDPFQGGTLGNDDVGVTVLDVFHGSKDTIMTHAQWPLSRCWFPAGRSLLETLQHFSANPLAPDPLGYLGGMLKAPYRFIVRKPSTAMKDSQFILKTEAEQIRKVSSLKCCESRCCQLFLHELTLKVRQKFYLKSFEDRRQYGIAAGGQIHSIDGIRNRKFITLDGCEVCTTAWYLIHGIHKSTYHSYLDLYKAGVISGTHGNKGIKRPRTKTVQVSGTMKAIIDDNADQMPHQMRSIGNGRMDTLKYLPAANNWKRVRAEANELNVEYGLSPVSQSTISRLKKELFNNVSIKPVGSTFAKCTTCDQLQQFILKSPKGSPEYVEFVAQRNDHLNLQMSCRRLYASWRDESKRNPGKVLCVIHDKMDTAKTAIPRLRVTTKAMQGLGQLPISVTGMVSHGHGDGAYAHYAPSCWPGDSNFTISSLTRLLRRLEGPSLRESGHLFPYPPANPMFEALLWGKSRCKDSLKLLDADAQIGSVPLPTSLYLQLDNSAKDNKNQFLMAFLSLLTARRVFKEIHVGFLLVGHTHEDIDAYFSHLSKKLKSTNTYVLADLMKAFMDSQDLSFVPEIVQEVGDFKSYVSDFICSGASKIIGLGNIHLFWFYVDDAGIPVMRYKQSAVDTQWLPSERRPPSFWKRDSNGSPLLPQGNPKPVPFKPMWGSEVPISTGNQDKAREMARKATLNKGFMLVGLQKYIDYWKVGMSKCTAFREAFGPFVDYWNRVLHELMEPHCEGPLELAEGFWPQHDWAVAAEDVNRRGTSTHPVNVIPEQEVLEPYCGPANEAPQETFNPWVDVRSGSWVLLRPEDPHLCPVWLGRALSSVITVVGELNYGKFLLQYWEPDNSKADLQSKYQNCWSGRWVPEKSTPTWVDATCVVFSNWSKVQNPLTKTIPAHCRAAALANLDRSNAEDP